MRQTVILFRGGGGGGHAVVAGSPAILAHCSGEAS